MPSQAEKSLPRCLLCSMGCPIGAQVDRLGKVRSVFPNELGVEHGACVLGVTAAHLLRAENRIYRASCNGEDATLQDALRELQGRILGFDGSQVAFLVDANRPLEGIAAAAAVRSTAFAAGRLALFVPPEDESFVRAGAGACPDVGALADCDLVVAVGDPFSTHPVISSPVRDMQRAARGNRLISVDTCPGRTAEAADESIVLDPFKLAGFLCAVAIECGCGEVRDALGGAGVQDVCGKLGVAAHDVRALADALRNAKAPAIIVSGRRGRYAHADAVVRVAGELAGAVNAQLFPLPISANSLVAGALAERLKAVSPAEVLREVSGGHVRALIVVGVDMAAVLPRRIWQELRDKVEMLAWAGSLRSEFADAADIVLPLALPWEESGLVLLPGGELGPCERWVSPPEGIPTTRELMEMLGERLGVGPIEPETLGDLQCSPRPASPVARQVTDAVLQAPTPGAGEAIVMGAPEPYGYTGALSLSGANWQERMAGQERAVVSASLAADMGVCDGDLVTLAGAAEATLPCVVREGGEVRAAALPSHRPELCGLLEWEIAPGSIEINPAIVKVSKTQ